MNLFPGLDEYMQERALESQKSYEHRLLRALYKALLSDEAFVSAQKEAGEDFGFEWFNDTVDIPIILFANKSIKVSPAQILNSEGFTRTDLWVEYFMCKNAYPKGTPVGLFFPMSSGGQFILHGADKLDLPTGCNVMIRHGRTPGTLLRVEPAKAFIEVLARQYKR